MELKIDPRWRKTQVTESSKGKFPQQSSHMPTLIWDLWTQGVWPLNLQFNPAVAYVAVTLEQNDISDLWQSELQILSACLTQTHTRTHTKAPL